MNIYRSALLFYIVLSLQPALALSGQPELMVNEAWIQEGPPNASVLAGFMHIHNNSSSPVSITSAHSKLFKRVEFHRTVYADGMARMEMQHELTIKPGAALKLEHGGYHLMLIQPLKQLKTGDTVMLTLTLSSGTNVPVKLQVREPEQGQQQHHHH